MYSRDTFISIAGKGQKRYLQKSQTNGPKFPSFLYRFCNLKIINIKKKKNQ